MTHKTRLILALLLFAVQGVWAWEGSGTTSDPYLIQNLQDWKALGYDLAHQKTYEGKFFRLTADLDLEGNSIGSENNPFSGTFDGDGHTLTYNRGTSSAYVDEYCAPFICLDGATIRHLNVTGSIYSNHMHAAGIASMIDGSKPTTIKDCHVSSLLSAGTNLASDASFAGLVGNVNPTCTASPVIQKCSFTGSIMGSATRSSGLVGYTNQPITFENCLFDPKVTPLSNECSTMVRTAPGVTCTFKECYYTTRMGSDQGQCIFTDVSVPDGCTAKIISEPFMQRDGKKYYRSGVQVELIVPEGTAFDHWVTEGAPGCFINDPWTASGVHTLSDVRSKPMLGIATSMPAPVQSNRERYGINYRYLSNRDYLLFMSDSLRQARGYQFDGDGELFVYDSEGTKNWVTVVWNCDANSGDFQNYFRTGWFWEDKNYEGSLIYNDLVAPSWEHTHLFAIAPRAFQSVKQLKRLVFISNLDTYFRGDCLTPLDVMIQEQAFKDSGIEELVMMYWNEKEDRWVIVNPSAVMIADNAFEGTDCKVCLDPSVYQEYVSSKNWSAHRGRINIYAAKVEDMKVNGAIYSYWRDNQGEPLKNNDAGHKSMLEVLKYWNADYQQFNAATLFSNSSKNIWYTQVIGGDGDYLKKNDGVMRIYNDPGSQYNYKTINIRSLGQSKDVKAIEFYQTNGLSDNSYTDMKIVIQNNALKGCDNLKELRLFYYVEDGDDRWTALGPKDVIPGDNIFGLKQFTDEEIRKSLADETALHSDSDPKIPEDFKILVSPELYPEFLDDPNWLPYLAFIEPVDYSPSTKKDITKGGLTYGFMTNPGGIMQTSQTVSQDVSWWTAPRIAIEVILWAWQIYKIATIPSGAALAELTAAEHTAMTDLNLVSETLTTETKLLETFKEVSTALAATGKKATTANFAEALSLLNGKSLKDLFVNQLWVQTLEDMGVLDGNALFLQSDFLLKKNPLIFDNIVECFKSILKTSVQKQTAAVAARKLSYNSFKAAARAAQNALFTAQQKTIFNPIWAKALGAAASATSTTGYLASRCWDGTYDGDMLKKGMYDNIMANMHQVGLVGGGYVITTPNKNLLYHIYVKDVAEDTKDAVIYAGFDDDNNSSTSDRTMTFSPKAFRNHKNLKTVRFHSMEDQSSNAGMPMLLTIPDSAFVGCDNLVEFSTLLEDNEKGTRALGPENFILAGDSIFAGLDSTKFHIVIDPSRKEDYLQSQMWAPLKRFFTYRDAQPEAKYNVYGGQYAYSYENNSIKREHKVSGHLIEHTEVIGADNSFLDEHQGALKLCNDIGRFDNFQIDAVHRKAFKGNEHLRVVNFTDLYGAGAFGDSYTGLEMALGDSCFANCKNLANIDMLYLVTDGDNHIDPITPEMVKIGNGVLDGTNARIKMMPQQEEWFLADSAWATYKDRFMPCIIQPADDGIKAALSPWAYLDNAYEGNDWGIWNGYIDLTRIREGGFSWLDDQFTAQKNDILSFYDFKYFDCVGLDYVGKEWFRGCAQMSNIMLPQTIKTIQEHAFDGCAKLQEIELPEGLTKIESSAFADCSGLKTIVVSGMTPATLGNNAFPKNEGMKIYVPAESLNNYLKAWAEYKDYIVSRETYKMNKVVKVDQVGTLADKLGLSVEWDYSGPYAGDEPRYLHGNYSKYDSLTVSGPLNNLDLWVIRYLAGSNGYNRGGVASDGKLRFLNLYDAEIKKDTLCRAHYFNGSKFINNLWREVTTDNVLPIQLFHGCTALEGVILPKSLTTITTGIFEGCKSLKRVAMTGALKEYDGSGYYLFHMLDYPLEELVLLTDGHATSDAKDPWGQNIGVVYTTQARFSDYLNDPCLVSKTEDILPMFQEDVLWGMLVDHGEFFPSQFTEKEDVGTIFSEQNRQKNLKTFDEFQYFRNVKELHATFAYNSEMQRVTLPTSVELIGEDAFYGCLKLKTITLKGDSVPELAGDPFKNLPSDFVIYVPRNVVKAYRTKWAQYADHINPEATSGGSYEIITVTLTEPNTLAEKLGLTPTWVPVKHVGKMLTALRGVRGDYSNIRRLKVIGPISGGDLVLMRYLAGYCSWTNTRNFAGQLEYIDLYDAQLKATDYNVASDVVTTRNVYVDEENVLPAYSFLQCYNLKTLILPRTLKEVRSRALQQCEYLETLVLGEDMEEFNWNALDDDASLTRMYILAKNKVDISTENTVWRWLCNNYNPTFDAFYVRPSLYEKYLMDSNYTGSSWQRTNNISKGVFEDDDAFVAFASHAAATQEELAGVLSVDGWFDAYPGAKDLTPLRFTAIDTLSKATLAPLTKLERVALPITLKGMEDGLFENAKGLRYADFLFCDSTNVVSKLHGEGMKRLGINTEQTLVYVPSTYGESDGTNIISFNGTTMHTKVFNMIDSLDYLVPYEFEAEKVTNTRVLTESEVPYTVCVPYKMAVPEYSQAYVLSERDGNTLVFSEVEGEMEAMKPYLVKVNGLKRYNIDYTTLNTEIEQTIPASSITYGGQDETMGYTLRGTFEGIDNATAAELGAYILQSDGDWHPVSSTSEDDKKAVILPYRAYLLPNMHNAKASIRMTLEDTTGIDSIKTVDKDGTARYYDLNGRELPGKPAKGVYIYKGKKYTTK